jgi:hypothetical protein
MIDELGYLSHAADAEVQQHSMKLEILPELYRPRSAEVVEVGL